MLIYTFVENAIKHGIRHLEGKGELVITAESLNKTYTLTISDNGIGRSKAKDYSKFSTGKGLSILDQILDLYFKIEGVRINYEIIDILDDIDKPKGTKVIIKVPIKTKAS